LKSATVFDLIQLYKTEDMTGGSSNIPAMALYGHVWFVQTNNPCLDPALIVIVDPGAYLGPVFVALIPKSHTVSRKTDSA